MRVCPKLASRGEEELMRADNQRKRWFMVIKGDMGEKFYHSRKNWGFRVRMTTLRILALLLTCWVNLEK